LGNEPSGETKVLYLSHHQDQRADKYSVLAFLQAGQMKFRVTEPARIPMLRVFTHGKRIDEQKPTTAESVLVWVNPEILLHVHSIFIIYLVQIP